MAESELTFEVPAPQPSIVLNDVISVAATIDEGAYSVVASFTVGGEQMEAPFGLRAEDSGELATAIRQWLVDNPGFPIAPHLPPTEEEERARMPALTARQFRLGLVNAGISPSTVTTTIAAMPAGADRDKAQIEWEYATTFNRMHPLIASVGSALGLNDQQIDAMWTAAVSL
ncbi:hypothetical protein IB270_07510 [Ensifer sp. ENS05]|uniref:hypothetical protein n=1 Tax=Ensifer sp. ENS05 TaxID=2769277 RepID=UPI00177C86EE|nr:hypothetical protein [Ensifer sp. ENS05]MBD9592676.1 hypothetical protein [Ensifer sp. ENS05]